MRWNGAVRPLDRCLIAWGGVLGQSALFTVSCLLVSVLPVIRSDALHELIYALIVANFFLVLLNLLPMRPLDGAEAWRIVPVAGRAMTRWLPRASRRASARRTLRRLERLEYS